MGEMKTIISANIPVSVAKQLQGKTKGTRSRVITRALKAYLADRDAFDIEDISTEKLLLEICFRKELSESQKQIVRSIWKEVKQ